MQERELRFMLTEIRVTKGGKLSGYAALYNSDSRPIPQLGGQIERILPGAFDRSLAAAEEGEQDITLNCSHNEMFTLGSVAMGNLRVSSDEKGLKFDVTPPGTEYAKAAVEAVREGRMNKCSFSFVPIKEQRTVDGVRELKDLILQHITICRPDLAAYPATGVEARTVGEYAQTEARIYGSVSEVPGYVPKDARKQWMDIWNSAYKAAKDKGLSDKDAEAKAFAEASGVIKKESKSLEDDMARKVEERAVKYLVKEDDDTEHLPVTDENGKPDHHLMGAAWAALHEGYRGNKYEGPNKQKAIDKLKGMYKSEGMPLPDSNRTLEDQSEVVGELRARVRSLEIDKELLAKSASEKDTELADVRQQLATAKTEAEEQRMARKAMESELRIAKEQAYTKIPAMERAAAEQRQLIAVTQQQLDGMKQENERLKEQVRAQTMRSQRALDSMKAAAQQHDMAKNSYDQAHAEMERGMMGY